MLIHNIRNDILFIITIRGENNEYPKDEIDSNLGRSINYTYKLNTFHS